MGRGANTEVGGAVLEDRKCGNVEKYGGGPRGEEKGVRQRRSTKGRKAVGKDKERKKEKGVGNAERIVKGEMGMT